MQMTARVGCSSLTLFFCFRHIFLSGDKLCFRVVLLKLYHTVSPLVILLNFQLEFSSAWLLGRGSLPQTRRGLTLLSQLCRDPVVGVRNGEEA